MLDLAWVAEFKDGSSINQYDKEGNETKFKAVLDKKDELKRFMLVNRHSLTAYLVDLTKGFFTVGKVGGSVLEPRVDMFPKGEYHYRLIYFREVERAFGPTLKEIGEPSYTFFVGFQYTDENNRNVQTLAKIKSNGEMAIV